MPANADDSGEELRAIQDGVVTERSRSERRANPDGSAPTEHSYAPTSLVGSALGDTDFGTALLLLREALVICCSRVGISTQRTIDLV